MLKVALIGTGKWGGNILRTLNGMRGVDVVVFDENNKATTKKDIEGLDAALVATPGSTHLEVALPFIKQGIPTYIEKPMTTSLRDARTLKRAAEKSGVPVFVGHIHLYNEAFLKLKELVKGVGKIRTVHFEGMNDGPIRDDMSVLWDWGPHGVSMILDLLGKPTYVQGWGYLGLRPKTKLYDEVKARLLFVNNIEATCSMSWLSPEKRVKLTVIGSRYSVVMDDTANRKISVYRRGKVSYPSYRKRSPLKNELKAFIDVVKSKKRRHKTDVKNGLVVVNILSHIEKSMEFDGREMRC